MISPKSPCSVIASWHPALRGALLAVASSALAVTLGVLSSVIFSLYGQHLDVLYSMLPKVLIVIGLLSLHAFTRRWVVLLGGVVAAIYGYYLWYTKIGSKPYMVDQMPLKNQLVFGVFPFAVIFIGAILFKLLDRLCSSEEVSGAH